MAKKFNEFMNILQTYAKTGYYPDTYNDFNRNSIGIMFMGMVASVATILEESYESLVVESSITHAQDPKNVVSLAEAYGYTPKTSYPASTNIEVYQLIPSTGVNGSEIDFKYALKIEEEMIIRSSLNPNIEFRTIDSIDFSLYDDDNFTATVYEKDENQNPSMYLIKKTVRVVAGKIYTTTLTIDTTDPYKILTLPYTDIIEILDVYDNNGNRWYNVDFLSQDTIIVDEENSNKFNSLFPDENNKPHKILKMKRVDSRFVISRDMNGYIQLKFGAGTSNLSDNVFVATPETVKYPNGIANFIEATNSYLSNRTYGKSLVAGMSLTIRYTRGGGVSSNVTQGDLTNIVRNSILNTMADFDSEIERNLFTEIKNSLAVTNFEAATGGKNGDSFDEMKQNAMASLFAQNRCITERDYLFKVLSMPSKYGNISKAYVEKNSENFTIDVYCLGYNVTKKLTILNDGTKQNLRTYLDHYRDLTTVINIKDGYIINIGVKFSIVVLAKFNKNEVMIRSINAVKDFFNIDSWQIGQPIVLRDIYEKLDAVEGMRTVVDIEIYNKYDYTQGYSNNFFHIGAATIDGVIYPSLDPSIFEVKFPDVDIECRAK